MRVFIVGLGTIGEPLARIFIDMAKKLGVDEVIVHKNTSNIKHREALVRLCKLGAKLAVYEDKVSEFKKYLSSYAIIPQYTFSEALEKADVVINCTKKNVGNNLKSDYYNKFIGSKKLFIAQGSENGFGKPYALGSNDKTLTPKKDQFIQIVSCNTHQILSILNTIVFNHHTENNLQFARFFISRRSNDISQSQSIVGVEVGTPENSIYGSHQGVDAMRVLDVMGHKSFNIYTIVNKLSNSFMHVVNFDLILSKFITFEEIEKRFRFNPLTAVTYRHSNNGVFNEGRSWGYSGRILNQAVICLPSVKVISNGYEVIGGCFTPQDGNVILSSVAATLWFIHPKSYLKIMKKFFYTQPFLFDEI